MQIAINEKQKELKEHGNYGFPIHISYETISQYDSGRFLWHWHPEIELTFILEGTIEYYADNKKYLLKQGEGLFANANVLHAGNRYKKEECRYLSITFHPRFIYGYENSVLQNKYVENIIQSRQFSSLLLNSFCTWQKKILEKIKKIEELFLQKEIGYELKIHIELCEIWFYLLKYFETLPKEKTGKEKNKERLKGILSFIQKNYKEKITLEDISASVNICKSECCRFFKKHMNMSLFDYLLSYRIEQSLPLLREMEYSITEVAGMVGFANPCYYAKIFKRYWHCSPKEYRKMQITENE